LESPTEQSAAPQRRATLTHLPALDGLRGAAVIGVLFFHDDRLRGGYLGVDLFFVLSGFLITSLLVAEQRATGRVDLRAFWIRRARRLFPAVLSLMPGVALYARLFAKPSELARIRGDGVATLLYFANWRSIFAGKSYWDLFSAPSPLEHTWSLAIEEQFYVVWPLLSFFVLRRARAGTRALFVVSVVLALASAAAMLLLYDPDSTSRAYMGTDTRGASILAGAALACALSPRGPIASAGAVRAQSVPMGPQAAPNPGALRALDVAGFVAMVGLGVAWATMDGQGAFLYHGGFWLTEAAVLVLIACAAQDKKSLVAKVFSIAPLRGMGLVSYGVYLWHWPLFVVLTSQRVGFGGWKLTALRLAATLAVALVSYRWLEQPIRKRGITFGRPAVVVPLATAAAVLCLFVGTRAGALPPPGAPAIAAPGISFFGPSAPYNADITALPAASAVPEGTVRVLVVGDSVAVALGDRLRFVQESGRAKVAVRAVGDCNVLDEQYPTKSLNNRRHDGGDCDAHWSADVAELRPDVILVILGGGFFAPVEIGGKWRVACEKEWHDAYRAELERNAKLLGAHGGRVVLVKVPYPVDHWASEKWDKATDCFDAMLGEVAAAVPGVKLLPLKEKLCPGTDSASCTLTSQGAPVRPDGMHFEGLGGEEIARWALSQLR
jgi:peptidoglycan/LPS O-acetylase OafA/YrhL